jgi:hypothetical protein
MTGNVPRIFLLTMIFWSLIFRWILGWKMTEFENDFSITTGPATSQNHSKICSISSETQCWLHSNLCLKRISRS